MISSRLVKQIVSYGHIAYELEETLQSIQSRGYKVLKVVETKVSNTKGCTDQAFIIIYDTGEPKEKER